jgi:hypothetical protein
MPAMQTQPIKPPVALPPSLARLTGKPSMTDAERRTERFLSEVFAGRSAQEMGMFFDADGRDQTALIRGMVTHLDALTEEVGQLADRLKLLEQIVATDEQRIAAEIEALRRG